MKLVIAITGASGVQLNRGTAADETQEKWQQIGSSICLFRDI